MNHDFEHIFETGDHIDESRLWLYVQGKLNHKDTHDVEKHLNDCEMCRDVVVGLSSYSSEGNFNASVNRTTEAFYAKMKKKSTLKLRKLSIAAILLILAGSSYMFVVQLKKSKVPDTNLAQELALESDTLQQETAYLSKDTSIESDIAINTLDTEESLSSAKKKETSEPFQYSTPPPPPAEVEEVVVEELNIVEDDQEEENIDINTESDENTEIEINMNVFEKSLEAEDDVVSCEAIAFAIVEDKPVFPGGDNALLRYLSENTKYPEKAKESGIQGRVFVQFIIDKTGKVTDVRIARGVSPELDEEAKRVVSTLPKWTPGKQQGKPVPVTYIVPINFRLY